MLTEVERIHSNGVPHPNRWTWASDPAPIDDWIAILRNESSVGGPIRGTLAALAKAIDDITTGPDEQRYRILAFLISPFRIPINNEEDVVFAEEIRTILESGDDVLPAEIEQIPFRQPSILYQVRLFVYEFAKAPGRSVEYLPDSTRNRLDFSKHMQGSGLADGLEKLMR